MNQLWVALSTAAMAGARAAAPAAGSMTNEPIQPAPLTVNQDPARAAPGLRLFKDERLSAGRPVSCARCRQLANGDADGLASDERPLIAPHARFDQSLRGKHDAISARKKQGYGEFKQYGCVACHQRVNVVGKMVQKFGVTNALRDGKAQDQRLYKEPGLRDVAEAAPYFHMGGGLRARSDGAGKGATFTLILPVDGKTLTEEAPA